MRATSWKRLRVSCLRRSSKRMVSQSSNELEKRVVATLLTLMDGIDFKSGSSSRFVYEQQFQPSLGFAYLPSYEHNSN